MFVGVELVVVVGAHEPQEKPEFLGKAALDALRSLGYVRNGFSTCTADH